MAGMTVGELVARFDVDSDPAQAGILRAELAMRGLQRDADGRIRDMRGSLVDLGSSLDDVGTAAENGGARAAHALEDVGARADRSRQSSNGFRLSLGSIANLAGPLGGVGGVIGRWAGILGAAVPPAAGIVATLVNILPAAGIATTGLLMVVSATAALKLGISGVGDALKVAFDPAKAQQFNDAMAKLAPSAQAFVREIQALHPAFDSLKLDVQGALFQGLDGTLSHLGRTVLPVLRQGLIASAGHLNDMAKGAAGAAANLAESGVLGRALASANRGLGNLAGIPGQVVTGLGQIAAAAGPAFERITGGAGKLATTVADKLSAAFSSGGMGKAIDLAVSLLGQLGDVVLNVGKILGSVLGAAQQTGGGFVGTLVKISGAMATAFASPAVQSGLQALFGVMGTLASTVAPLLGQALQVIGPVLAALGPPVQVLIQALGAALSPIIAALGPVLLVAAKAVGALVIGASPLLGLVGTLVSALLPSLTPLLAGAGLIFQQLSPLVQAVSTALAAALGPVLAQLPALITPFVTILTELTGALLPMLTQLITQLPLASLGQSFAQIAIALTPLLAQLAVLIGDQLRTMMPLLGPIIVAVAELAAIFAGQLARVIQSVVIPTINTLTDLLHGNFSGAVDAGKTALGGLVSFVTDEFTKIPGAVLNILGDLASALFTAGGKIISGLIDGIKSKIPNVKDAVGNVMSSIAGFLPHSPAKEGPFSGSGWTLYSGQAISAALADGMLGGQGRVKAATQSLMSTAHGGLGGGLGGQFAMAGGPGGGGYGMHIENYHESANGSARSTAEELWWLRKGRG